MSSCAIMQPSYLPWSGYFNLIASVDKFVLLDDVQFERGSWQNRNKILLNGKAHLISIPTHRTHLREAILNQIEIFESKKFKMKHWKVLEHAYRKAKYGDEALQLLRHFYVDENHENLVNFNGSLIRKFCHALSIKTTISYASEMNCNGKRSEHVAAICKYLNCQTYLSPQGAANYLEADLFVAKFGINLKFQNFLPAPYTQYQSTKFVSHLSILDVIANIGVDGARKYIQGQPTKGLNLYESKCATF